MMFAVAIVSLLAACGDDGEVSNNDAPVNTISGMAPIVNGKRLTKIVGENRIKSFEYNSTGQLAKIIYMEATRDSQTGNILNTYLLRTENYSYSYNKITRIDEEKDGHSHYSYLFLSNGVLDRSSGLDDYYLDPTSFYEYDVAGNLKKFKSHRVVTSFSLDLGDGRPITSTKDDSEFIYQYIWQNGNISSITRDRSSTYTNTTKQNDVIVSGPTTTYSQGKVDVQIKYSSLSCYIPLSLFLDDIIGVNSYLLWQGFAGNRCMNLPSEINYTCDDSYMFMPDNINYNFNYEMTDGLVTKIIITNNQSHYTSVLNLEWQ